MVAEGKLKIHHIGPEIPAVWLSYCEVSSTWLTFLPIESRRPNGNKASDWAARCELSCPGRPCERRIRSGSDYSWTSKAISSLALPIRLLTVSYKS